MKAATVTRGGLVGRRKLRSFGRTVNMTPAEAKLIKMAADVEGGSVGWYMRRAAVVAARQGLVAYLKERPEIAELMEEASGLPF